MGSSSLDVEKCQDVNPKNMMWHRGEKKKERKCRIHHAVLLPHSPLVPFMLFLLSLWMAQCWPAAEKAKGRRRQRVAVFESIFFPGTHTNTQYETVAGQRWECTCDWKCIYTCLSHQYKVKMLVESAIKVKRLNGLHGKRDAIEMRYWNNIIIIWRILVMPECVYAPIFRWNLH